MKKKIEITQDNIFQDLGLEQPDELIARAKLLRQVGNLIKSSKVAKRLGISQPTHTSRRGRTSLQLPLSKVDVIGD